MTEFGSEKDLVDAFLRHLKAKRSPWGKVRYSTEFFYQSGKTDVVIVMQDGTVVAIEAKLDRWKDAAHQAYRNTTFANESYVLVPERTAAIARRNEHEFELRKVGICCIRGNNIEILRAAEKVDPVQVGLHQRAVSSTVN